jgi:ATP-dependent Lon protease
MATALVSLLTDRCVRPYTAMTGEITLSGHALPVGGIKEKVLAARRAGVHDVILPAENKMNVDEDLTKDQLEGVTIHYVRTIGEALAIALPSSKAEQNHDDQRRDEVLSRVPEEVAVRSSA